MDERPKSGDCITYDPNRDQREGDGDRLAHLTTEERSALSRLCWYGKRSALHPSEMDVAGATLADALEAARVEIERLTQERDEARALLDRLREYKSVLLYLVGGIGASPSTEAGVEAVAALREALGEGPAFETRLDGLTRKGALLALENQRRGEENNRLRGLLREILVCCNRCTDQAGECATWDATSAALEVK